MNRIRYTSLSLLLWLAFIQNATGQCAIFDLVATPGDCINGQFYVTLNFQFAGVGGDGFKVQGNGVNYGTFNYNNVPLTLGPLPGNGSTPYEFVVRDFNHPDCSDFFVLGTVDCGGTSDCHVFDLIATPGDCNADGTYPLTINFQYENAPNAWFDLIYEGSNIGFYPLSELPVVIPAFNDNGEPGQVISVCINDTPDCCAIADFQAPNCNSGDCNIFDVTATPGDCENGMFYVTLDFNYENVGDGGFKVQGNGIVYGVFEYGDLPLTLGPLAGNGTTTYEFVVKDIFHPECNDFAVVSPVDCDQTGDCHIYDLVAEVSDCNDQGQFFVTLDFEHTNTGNDGFKVYGNGNVYGFFNYDDLPVTIGPLQTDNPHLEFGVADVQHPDCHDFVVIGTPDCTGGNNDCVIEGLVAEVHPCLANGTFYVTLDFQHENTSGYFKVKGNGVTYGVYSYDDLPVSIGPLVGNGTTNYEFVVRDIHQEDCGDAISIGTVECAGAGDCDVHDLIADPGDCHDDGTYNIWVYFEVENPTNNFYDVFHNGSFVDYFSLAHVPTTLHDIHGNGEPFQTVKVCINDNPNCCATVEYPAPDCNGANLVWPGDANADNVADHFDLLNLGLGFNAHGPQRLTQGIDWLALEADNWDHLFGTQLNFKHADCNGDGKVTAGDREAILVNYGESHGAVQAPVFVAGTEDDPPFFVDLPEGSALTPGASFVAPITLGTEAHPVTNLYGIAFTLHFDPDLIHPSSLQLQYDPSWLGVQNMNLLHFDRTHAEEGTIDVALVRTNQNNVSGHGPIAAITGIIDNMAGNESMSIEISGVRAIRENETLVPLSRPVEIVDMVTGANETLPELAISVYPNPAGQTVYFSNPAGLSVETVEIRDVDSRLIKSVTVKSNQLDVSPLAPGVYFLKIKAGGHIFHQRLVRL